MVVYNFGINIISYNFKGVYRNKSGEGGGKFAQSQNFFLPPPPGAPRGEQNLNGKFKTFGFLDIRHKYQML